MAKTETKKTTVVGIKTHEEALARIAELEAKVEESATTKAPEAKKFISEAQKHEYELLYGKVSE